MWKYVNELWILYNCVRTINGTKLSNQTPRTCLPSYLHWHSTGNELLFGANCFVSQIYNWLHYLLLLTVGNMFYTSFLYNSVIICNKNGFIWGIWGLLQAKYIVPTSSFPVIDDGVICDVLYDVIWVINTVMVVYHGIATCVGTSLSPRYVMLRPIIWANALRSSINMFVNYCNFQLQNSHKKQC